MNHGANSISRRNFLTGLAAVPFAFVQLGCAEAWLGSGAHASAGDEKVPSKPTASSYDSLLAQWFSESKAAGVQACAIENGQPIWHGALGWADLANRVAMSPDIVMNIASISKTVTAAAIMQLVDQGRVTLDQDVNKYLSFSVRNPIHPATAITVRQLLTHTSSIDDGPAYAQNYSCGNQVANLGTWMSEYLSSRGHHYSRDNFHSWSPGEQFAYSNAAFGLLGCVVEGAAKMSFPEYCAQHIFRPLGMASTSFGAASVSTSKQAIPYTLLADGGYQGRVISDGKTTPIKTNRADYVPNCLYSFPTMPDGLLRTSVRDFAKFVSTMLCEGQCGKVPLLRPSTVRDIFRPQQASAVRPSTWPDLQGIAWYALLNSGHEIWQHSGVDPGINTLVVLHLPTKSAVILFVNTAPTEHMGDVAGACLRLAAKANTHQH